MSEVSRKSVSERVSQSEEIFLQPIDQQYERINKFLEVGESSDSAFFFEEYDQKGHMGKMLCLLEGEELLTDCDSPNGLSVKGEDDHARRASFKLCSLLKDDWESQLESTIRSQKSLLTFLAEQKFRNSVLSPFTYRTRAYSNALPATKLSFSDSCPFFRAETMQSPPKVETAFNADKPGSIFRQSGSNAGQPFFRNFNS